MSKLSLSIFLNAYEDHVSTNAPGKNNFRWNKDIQACIVHNPTSESATVAPGETLALFNGTRTLAQDSTTVYSISLVPLTTNTYQLSAVSGTLPNFRTPRVTGADATTQVTVTVNGPVVTFSGPAVSAVAATFVGFVAGMSTSITLTANTAGAAGNSIVLTGDGTSSVNTLITNWNTTNPSNQVTLSSGDGTQIPSLGATIQLSGGKNSATALNLISGGAVVGDDVIIGNDFNTLNQGQFQIIALTTTSFSVENQLGVAEGPILFGSSFASQIQIFSAAGVQDNDTLIISGGFSPVTQGSYKITQVSANSLQFYSTAALPQESGIMTEAINIYSEAKNLIYLESDSKISVIINGVTACDIEPFIIHNSIKSGVFMLKSTVYSLSLLNSGINSAKIFFASVE